MKTPNDKDKLLRKIPELGHKNVHVGLQLAHFKKLTDDEHKDETLKKLLEITDFRASKLKSAIEKSMFYNFTISQLEDMVAKKNLKFTQPPQFVRDGFGDSFFLKINKKYYEV